MDRFEQKIDRLIEGQQEQALAIQNMRDIMEKVILEKLTKTTDCLAKLKDRADGNHSDHEIRITKLEGFGWFERAITKLRDNLVSNLLMLIGIGGILYAISLFGKEIIKRIAG